MPSVLKDLGALSDTKLNFYNHIHHVAKGFKILHLIHYIMSSFSTIDTFILYCALVGSKLEFASVTWNSLTVILPKSKEFQENLLIYATTDFLSSLALVTKCSILARLYLSMLQSRQRHLAAVSYCL
jgi:hypothetical protein